LPAQASTITIIAVDIMIIVVAALASTNSERGNINNNHTKPNNNNNCMHEHEYFPAHHDKFSPLGVGGRKRPSNISHSSSLSPLSLSHRM